MSLTLRCPRSYTSPTHSISNILWHNWIEKFCCRRYFHACNIDHQLSCHKYSILHIFSSIEMRIADESFPAYIGTRFFKIDTHDYFQYITIFFSHFFDFFCVFFCRFYIMNRTRSYDDCYLIIFAFDNISDRLDALFSCLSSLFG